MSLNSVMGLMTDSTTPDASPSQANDGEVYARLAPELVRYATALVGTSDASDVVSSAVVKALASPNWPNVREHRPYLYRAVFNEAATFRRRRSQRPERELRSAAPTVLWELPDYQPEVRDAVARLSLAQRSAVVLTYWADLDPASVAKVMGISEGSVRRHLARGRARLRKVLS